MTKIFYNLIFRNIKNIPYFFEKNISFTIKNQNYALLGKLSASLIHDILTPIQTLCLNESLSKTTENQTLNSYVLESKTQIKEYVEIMKDFLDQPADMHSIHINTEICKCIKLLAHKATTQNIQIQFIEFDQVYSNINSLYIYQILVNLISNAIDASAHTSNKKVIVLLKQEKDWFQIDCKDYGEGMTPDVLKNLCTLHFTTKERGCGLGLYSVKRIIHSYLKGTLTIHSEPNNGSLFSCKIPLLK